MSPRELEQFDDLRPNALWNEEEQARNAAFGEHRHPHAQALRALGRQTAKVPTEPMSERMARRYGLV